MEGPSVRIVAESLAHLKGRQVKYASGNARMDKESIEGRKIEDILTRGKNLFLKFSDFSLKIHFLMYGSYRLNENKKGAEPALSLAFQDDVLNFYNCSVRAIDYYMLEKLYDEEIDITAEKWDADKVFALVAQMKGELICDILLDQDVFAGVGNMIKNEALFMAKIHPSSVVGKMPEEKLREIISKARKFSLLFCQVRRKGRKLKPYLKVYRKRQCSECEGKVTMERTGKKQRISFFCPSCQFLYD